MVIVFILAVFIFLFPNAFLDTILSFEQKKVVLNNSLTIAMKAVYSGLLFLFFVSFSAFAPVFDLKNPHIGLWKSTEKGDVHYIKMDSAGYASFIFEKETIGGKLFNRDGVPACMKYKVNYAVVPHALDFIVYNKANNKEIDRMTGIFRFTKEGNLQICFWDKSPDRPTSFIESETITFTRDKP